MANETLLLLHCEGADGSTSVIDNSGWLRTPTIGGNAQISTAKAKFGGSSLYFDGSGDSVKYPSNVDFAFGTGDFTIEFWVYPTRNSGNECFIDGRTADAQGPYIGKDGTGKIRTYDGSTVRTGGSLSLNVWSHVAWVRHNGFNVISVNGEQVITFQNAFNAGPSRGITLGNVWSLNGDYYQGYLDEIRVTKGIAIYPINGFSLTTEAFPDTTLDPYFNQVSTLLHMDGSNGGTTFTDSSNNAITLTANGNANISTAQSKFGGASVYFDGSGDYLSAPSTKFTLAGDFTVEAWVYITSLGNYHTLIEARASANYSNYTIGLMNVSGTLRLDSVNAGGAGTRFTASSTSVPLNTWTHVALVRSNGKIRGFINGVQDATLINYSGSYTPASGSVRIGAVVDPQYFYGYLDDLRITNGVDRYSSSFTPPSSVFADSTFDPTRLYLQFNGADGSSIFVDSSTYNFPITTGGTAHNYRLPYELTRYVGKFPDNTANVKTVPNALLDIRDRAFTLSCWIYGNDISLGSPIYSRTSTTYGISYEQYFYLQPDGLYFYYGIRGTNQANVKWLFNFYPEKWYHIVWQRNPIGVWSVFVNGTELLGGNYSDLHGGGQSFANVFIGRYVNAVDFLGTTFNHVIHGAEAWSPAQDNVLLENFKLVIGATEYSGNFSPPDAPVVPISLSSARTMSADTEVISSVLSAAQMHAPTVEIISTDGSTGITSTQIVFEVLSSSSQTRRRPIVFVVT
jgi:hypothetical protein